MRKTMTLDDRLFRFALQQWAEWLQENRLPARRDLHRAPTKERADIGVWEHVCARARSNVEHTDSVLAQLLREERRGSDWPAAIHAIVLDMPGTWQMVLLGVALDLSQREIGEAVGVTQQNVSTMVSVIKTRFMPRLWLIGSTVRVCKAVLGISPHLRAA
jgi:hypothetical protein